MMMKSKNVKDLAFLDDLMILMELLKTYSSPSTDDASLMQAVSMLDAMAKYLDEITSLVAQDSTLVMDEAKMTKAIKGFVDMIAHVSRSWFSSQIPESLVTVKGNEFISSNRRIFYGSIVGGSDSVVVAGGSESDGVAKTSVALSFSPKFFPQQPVAAAVYDVRIVTTPKSINPVAYTDKSRSALTGVSSVDVISIVSGSFEEFGTVPIADAESDAVSLNFHCDDDCFASDSGGVCGFISDSDDRWMTKGCRVVERNRDQQSVRCECNHLTEFSLINPDGKKSQAALSAGAVAGVVIGILGAVAVAAAWPAWVRYNQRRFISKNNQKMEVMLLDK